MKKSNLKYTIPLILIGMIAISNVVFNLRNNISIRSYEFASTNSNFEYTCTPAKGINAKVMLKEKDEFNALNHTDITICRKFKTNYWKFWKWQEYLRNPYYKFPECK